MTEIIKIWWNDDNSGSIVIELADGRKKELAVFYEFAKWENGEEKNE